MCQGYRTCCVFEAAVAVWEAVVVAMGLVGTEAEVKAARTVSICHGRSIGHVWRKPIAPIAA